MKSEIPNFLCYTELNKKHASESKRVNPVLEYPRCVEHVSHSTKKECKKKKDE